MDSRTFKSSGDARSRIECDRSPDRFFPNAESNQSISSNYARNIYTKQYNSSVDPKNQVVAEASRLLFVNCQCHRRDSLLAASSHMHFQSEPDIEPPPLKRILAPEEKLTLQLTPAYEGSYTESSLVGRGGHIPQIAIKKPSSESVISFAMQSRLGIFTSSPSLKNVESSILPESGRSRPKIFKFAIQEHEPTMNDEIHVHVGDKLSVIKVFQDDWVFGKNETTGIYGVFPKSCYKQQSSRANTPNHDYECEKSTITSASDILNQASSKRSASLGGLVDFWMIEPDAGSMKGSTLMATPPRLLAISGAPLAPVSSEMIPSEKEENDPYLRRAGFSFSREEKLKAYVCSFLFIILILAIGLHI